jgi:aminoglycoside phosphotransferase (APT) family kinase protein
MNEQEASNAGGEPTGWFDTGRLEVWMNEHVAGFEGPIEVTKFPGGQSNPTFKLTTPGRQYVLRRKPPGKLLKGAHEVVGTPFFLMDMVPGRIFWDPTLPEVPKDARRAYYGSMCETIARLHQIDYEAAGLGDYGRAGNFFERQIGIWSKQYLQDEAAGRIGAMDRLVEWLPRNIPDEDGSTRIVHGDYRCDNLIFHPSEPRVVAVLDWELSTLGHPLADFAYHLMNYRIPPVLPAGMAGSDFAALGLPDEEEYTADYCRLTGRRGIRGLDFYIAFNMFRLAAIIHGIKGRILRGNASSDRAEKLVSHLESLAGLAWQQAEKAGA